MRTPPNERLTSDIVDTPTARNASEPERRCILTGETDRAMRCPSLRHPPASSARCAGKGAGAGCVVCSSRAAIEEAQGNGKLKAGLSRAFKTGDLEIPEELPQMVEDALTRVVLDRLGLEMRVGHLMLGTQRIAETARAGGVALLCHASDASEDGRKKLDQAWRVGREMEGSGERGLILPLDRDALSVALGRDNVVHLALADDAAAARVLKPLVRLMLYMGHDVPVEYGRAEA